jgi:hypothetical protein
VSALAIAEMRFNPVSVARDTGLGRISMHDGVGRS